MQRKLAASMSLTHTIALSAAGDQIRIVEKGSGPIDFDNTYVLGAKAVKTQV